MVADWLHEHILAPASVSVSVCAALLFHISIIFFYNHFILSVFSSLQLRYDFFFILQLFSFYYFFGVRAIRCWLSIAIFLCIFLSAFVVRERLFVLFYNLKCVHLSHVHSLFRSVGLNHGRAQPTIGNANLTFSSSFSIVCECARTPFLDSNLNAKIYISGRRNIS